MSVLEVRDVSIRYKLGDFKDIGLKEYVMRKLTGNYQAREFWADRHISFSLNKGDMLGIIGSNGAGKSTLLKAVSGIMEPTEGYVKRQGNIAALLELASGFDGDLTVKENAYLRGAMLGYTRKFMDETYEQIIEFAELKDFQDRPFKQLSSGMKSRLAFSIAAMVQPEILILDEVLSVGDGAFRKKSEMKMREIMGGGATTIFVSHVLGQIRELCNKVLWLEKGQQIAFGDTAILCDLYQLFLDKKITLTQVREIWAHMNEHYDYLIVGGGLTGAVFAREAMDHGKRCMVIDRRQQMGGNLSCQNVEGIVVHSHGPHVFHTNREEIWNYLNHYVRFVPCESHTDAVYWGVPENGYNELIDKLLEGSVTVTGMSYRMLIHAFPDIAKKTVYTGSVDEFFDYRLGHLEYRSLRFEMETLNRPDYQGQAIVECKDDPEQCTRIVEYKHFVDIKAPGTVIVREYEQKWATGREPYFPVENDKNRELYEKYMELAKDRPDVIFAGWLGKNRYCDMDETVAAALELTKAEW